VTRSDDGMPFNRRRLVVLGPVAFGIEGMQVGVLGGGGRPSVAMAAGDYERAGPRRPPRPVGPGDRPCPYCRVAGSLRWCGESHLPV
jgi:hypothetical protein